MSIIFCKATGLRHMPFSNAFLMARCIHCGRSGVYTCIHLGIFSETSQSSHNSLTVLIVKCWLLMSEWISAFKIAEQKKKRGGGRESESTKCVCTVSLFSLSSCSMSKPFSDIKAFFSLPCKRVPDIYITQFPPTG